MDKAYRSFGYFDHAERAIAVSAGLPALTAWLLPLLVSLFLRLRLVNPVRVSLSLSILLGAGAFLALRLARDIRRTVYVLTDTHFVRRGPSGTVGLALESIVSFRHRRIPGTNGFGIVRTRSHRIIIPFILQGLPDLARNLRRALERVGNGSVSGVEQFETFQRRAILNEHSTRRVFGRIPLLLFLCPFSFLCGLTVARVFWYYSPLRAWLWGVVTLTCPVVWLLVADALLTRTAGAVLHSSGTMPELDERKYFVLSAWGVLAAYLLLGIALA